MRKIEFAVDELYHICNRGVNKKSLFRDQRDYARLLFLLIYFQSPVPFYNLGRYTTTFVRRRAFNISADTTREIAAKRLVKVLGFALMPNHFHLLLEEVVENGTSTFLHRILTAYGKYFNTKYKESGHVFQGPFQAVHIVDNDQLLHTSAYIHRNCRELKDWCGREHEYPWASYLDYVGTSRWDKLLATSTILEQFDRQKDYKNFVDSSSAKTLDLLDAERLT